MLGGGQTCIVCKQMKGNDKNVSMYRFHQDESRRQQWIETLELQACNCEITIACAAIISPMEIAHSYHHFISGKGFFAKEKE